MTAWPSRGMLRWSPTPKQQVNNTECTSTVCVCIVSLVRNTPGLSRSSTSEEAGSALLFNPALRSAHQRGNRPSWYLILGQSWSRFPHANDCGQWRLSCHIIPNTETKATPLLRELEYRPFVHRTVQSADGEIFQE
jgi:hypothetical protein